jgi:hypothetical protein
MQTPVVPDKLQRVLRSYRAPLGWNNHHSSMIARQCFSGLSFLFDLGVVGIWSWRGCEPFGFGNVELICFEYRPALVTRLVRQTPAAFFYRVGRQCTRQNERMSRRRNDYAENTSPKTKAARLLSRLYLTTTQTIY